MTSVLFFSQNCVFYTSFGEKIGKTAGVLYVSINQQRTWVELQEFAKDDECENYLFLRHQLELFGSLCNVRSQYNPLLLLFKITIVTY